MSTDILYFDYWTRGIRHFSNIDINIRKTGMTTLLVHMGSQRGEFPIKEQIICNIKCKDLFFYDNNLLRMLDIERPKVVLLINNQTEDKIIVRVCRNLGIKTVFLMHGVLVPLENLQQLKNIFDISFKLRDRINRIPKYFKLFLQYLSAAKIKNIFDVFDPEIYLYFLRHAILPGSSQLGQWKYLDACADIALVYSEEDKNLFSTIFGYSHDQIKIVGNYNLDRLFDKQFHTSKSINLLNCTKYICYIENGFSDPKITIPGWSEELVANEVALLSDICNDFEYKLILKLHPSSDYSFILEHLANFSNIEIISECDLVELLSNASFVIGQSSTVLNTALALKKPIVILDIPPLKLKITTYSDRKLGFVVRSLDEFKSILHNAQNRRLPSLELYKATEQFLGPIDGKSTKRISDILLSLAR